LEDVEKRTNGVVEAGGGGLKVLLTRLQELQTHQQTEQYEITARVGESRLAPPDRDYVQGL
jgi:hypothetical protein